MEIPWVAINAATALISQSRNKEGFESMQRALTHSHVRKLLEERTKRSKNARMGCSIAFDEEPKYISVAVIYLADISECAWAFLNPLFIISPPCLHDNNVFAVCAVAAVNMGIAAHREAYAAKNCLQRRKLLQRAKLLYLRAEDLMLDEAPDLDSDESLFVVFPTLYINLVEVDMELGNFAEVDGWLRDLNDCVGCVPPWDESYIFRHFREACHFYCHCRIAANAA